jgi:acyl-CoA reductase-like NAD-dependent aldehyde dehydrogenase
METPTGLLVAGAWHDRAHRLPVINPWNRETVARVALADEDDVAAAVAAAGEGAKTMAGLPAHERGRILNRTADLVRHHAEALTDGIIAESGKPRRYAAAEVGRSEETLRFAAEEARRIHGETVPLDAARGSERRRGYFTRRPLGVIAAITPFNFPLNLVVHKVAPALAAGNAVVLKPASATPLTALRLGLLLLEAGLPPAALNIVVGPGGTVGRALVRDSRVRMVTFTGSAEVGEGIKTASGLKRVALELGSNSGAIIDETADIATALGRCLVGAFAYSGQVCIHTQRLYLHERIAGDFTARFVAGAERLRRGDPALAATEVGPMINPAALERGLALVTAATAAGARLLCGGTAEGPVMLPTVIDRVSPELPIVCEETFAPVVTIETFADFAEAVAMFNRGSSAGTRDYGLAAGIFTRDVNRALIAAETVEAGNIYINDSATFRADHQPYGGIRESGLGREGPRFAVEEMTDITMVSFNLDS